MDIEQARIERDTHDRDILTVAEAKVDGCRSGVRWNGILVPMTASRGPGMVVRNM